MRILAEKEWSPLIGKCSFDNLLCSLEKCEFEPTSIFLFDIDFTLVHPVNDIFKLFTLSKYRDIFYKMLGGLSIYEKSMFLNYLSYSLECTLTDSKVLNLMKAIQENGGNLLCISSMVYGDFLNLESVHKQRVNILKSLGIEFKNRFNVPNEFDFRFGPDKAVYFDGVIFTNSVENEGKALALNSFIRKLGSTTKIVYIDDNPDNLEEMERICHVNCEKLLVLDAYNPKHITSEINAEMFESVLKSELEKFRGLLGAKIRL